MSKAPSCGIRLREADAAIVKGMMERGDRQQDIAAWFGVNSGRVAEISTEEEFAQVKAVTENLPPPGPYLPGSAQDNPTNLRAIKKKLEGIIESIDRKLSQH